MGIQVNKMAQPPMEWIGEVESTAPKPHGAKVSTTWRTLDVAEFASQASSGVAAPSALIWR
jgi:hypothetical protein